jgi:hypothetical protein
MTGSFGRLLYTDCRPGDGLGSGGGFQIQAKSPNVDGEQARMAVGELTYSAQSNWFASERAVDDYPDGFAHSATAGFGTAQSRYLGAGVNDPRPGNHLADCILTRDGADYEGIRPAQLWRSSIWNSSARPTTDYPPLSEPLEEGVLTNDELARWLAADARRAPILKQLLTVLRDPVTPQVQIRSQTTRGVLSWIAAATVLMSPEAALHVSFRVFERSRNEPRFRVLGLHADAVPALLPRSRPGSFLLDDVELVSDEVEITSSADLWVERLLHAEDPDDVVEAVQLAGALATGAATPAQQMDAELTAWVLTSGYAGSGELDALARWLRSAPEAILSRFGDDVAQFLVSSDESTGPQLQAVNDLVEAGLLSRDAALVRSQLILAEIRDAQAGTLSMHLSRLAPVESNANEEARRAISSAMVVADDGTIDRLLVVAGRHGVRMQPATPAYSDRLHRFVAAWLSQPTRFDYRSWGSLDDSLIIDELAAQVRELGAVAPDAYRSALHSLAGVLARPDSAPDDQLAWDAEAVVTQRLEKDDRHARIRQVIAGQHVATTGLDLGTRLNHYQSSLLAWRVVDEDDDAVLLIVRAIPASLEIEPRILERASEIMTRRAARPDAATIKALRAMIRRLGKPANGPLRGLANEVEYVDQAVERLTVVHPQIFSPSDFAPSFSGLNRISGGVLDAFTSSFARASLQASSPLPSSFLLRALPVRSAQSLAVSVARTLQSAPDARTMSYVSAWLADDALGEDIRSPLQGAVLESLRSLSDEQRRSLVGEGSPRPTDFWRDTWAQLLDSPATDSKRSWWPTGKKR